RVRDADAGRAARVQRDAVRPGERPEVVVEGAVLLRDDDDVLDLVDVSAAPRHSGGGGHRGCGGRGGGGGHSRGRGRGRRRGWGRCIRLRRDRLRRLSTLARADEQREGGEGGDQL